MRNYSLVLRNCEHVAKYIFWGKWWSNQLAVSENLMNKFLDLVDRKDIKKLSNTPPFNLWRFGLERGQVVEEVKDVWEFKFRTKFTYYEPATFNVLLIGPTGAGKSNIINAVFKEPVAESGRRATGVSQAVMFYNGVMRTPKQENVRINLIDTIGFCDRVIPESEIVGMIRHLVLHKDVPIHKVLVIFGERIRDSEQDALKEYLKMMKFAENHDLFSLVLTKCNDMDSFERSSYSSSFHEVPLLQNFVNNLNGTSVTSDKPVLVPRTVCVDLIDITKVAGREEYYSNERARLLETMLFFTNTHISMKDSFC
jgi:GTP-binding protein EngB required for normal cell division